MPESSPAAHTEAFAQLGPSSLSTSKSDRTISCRRPGFDEPYPKSAEFFAGLADFFLGGEFNFQQPATHRP